MAFWLRGVLVLALLCVATGRDDFRPCARVHSVTGGEYGFSVRVAFERVRAMRCTMRIPITHVPERGTRYGERAGAVCENDGLGCIELLEPTTVVVDTDIPAYERDLEGAHSLTSFDEHAETVPFVHLGAQLSDGIGRKTLPYGTWVSQLFGMQIDRLGSGIHNRLMGVMHDILVSVVSEHGGLIDEGDLSIAPRLRVDNRQMIPKFSPMEASSFVIRGARAFHTTATSVLVRHSQMWRNDTVVMPITFRALSPTFRELLATDATLVALSERMLRLGLTEVEVFDLLASYNITMTAFEEDVVTLFGEDPAAEVINASSTKMLFPEPAMEIRFPSGQLAGCLTESDWESVLGSRRSGWEQPQCHGSTQCGVAGIGFNKPNQRMRRAVPYHLVASEPMCHVLRPKKARMELARVRMGAVVEIGDGATDEIVARLTLSPTDEVQRQWETLGDPTSVVMTVATTPESVPRLITDPSETLYLMNCFAQRAVIAEAVDAENPYLTEPAYTAPSVLERQRGTMILPTDAMDKVLGSGCGGMNFGLGFWRHFANRVAQAKFSSQFLGPDMLNGTHASLTDKLEHETDTLFGAFIQTGTSCIAGARCRTYSPCSLLRDEMRWMRYKGRLPPIIPPFNRAEPNLTPPPDITAFPGTRYERPSEPIVDRFKNVDVNKPRTVSFSCTPMGGGLPTTLSSYMWYSARMNMWVGSNRMGGPDAKKLYIEDTHLRHHNRISRGVTFDMIVDVPWSRVPHRHAPLNATGCVYMPIVTSGASPELACRDVQPALAGTAAASIVNGTVAELILVVECIGVSFCPTWNATLATLVDADTKEAIPAVVTVANNGAPHMPLAEVRAAAERFLANGSVGESFGAGTRFEDLPDYTGSGALLGEHIVFRFNQSVVDRRYVWEVHGGDVVSRALPDIFSREYFVQLFVGNTGVAASKVVAFNCHSLVKCELEPVVEPACMPPAFSFGSPPNVTLVEDNPCDFGFFDIGKQYECGSLVFWWVLFGIVEAAIIGGALFYYIKKVHT